MDGKKFMFLKVTYFTLLIFVLETIFFHVFNYIHDYFDAMLVLSYVILGIGLGAFFSNKISFPEKHLFLFCSLGTLISLYVTVFKILFFPSVGLFNFILLFVFLFPAIYVVRMYTEYKSSHIYLFDMLGCFLGVLFIVLLYAFLSSETMFLLLLVIIPLFSILNIFINKLFHLELFLVIFCFFLCVGGLLLYSQATSDNLNLYNLVDCDFAILDPEKSFCKYPDELIRSYDNLVGRIDVTSMSSVSFKVSYDGYSNDHFNLKTYESNDEEWGTTDIRILYGLVEDPNVFVIGSSAQGIIKPLKQITPPENIDSVELNPAIIQMMTHDFYEESSRAYEGLTPQLGNGISYFKSTDKQYDIITMINTHTYRNLPYDGPPDYLHTTETYDLFLNHLTDKGFILLEERPETDKGKYGLYRLILTFIHTLKERGVDNPLDHIVIWSWNWDEGEDEKYWHKYYISMIVTKNPITGEIRDDVIKWIEMQKNLVDPRIHLEFFNDYGSSEEFNLFFGMVEIK